MAINLLSIETGQETQLKPGISTLVEVQLGYEVRKAKIVIESNDSVVIKFQDGRYKGKDFLHLTGPNIDEKVDFIFRKGETPSFLTWESSEGRRRER